MIRLLLVILLFQAFLSHGQKAELESIDQSLCNAYKSMADANRELRYDSLAPAFKKQLLHSLSNPITFEQTLSQLSNHINIVTSPDQHLKFYSWDELEGGTWHTINCFAQFKAENGSILVQQIISANDVTDYTDSGIYAVYELIIHGTNHYLTMATGTRGSGHRHDMVQLFKIVGDKLEKCTSCFGNNKDLIVQYPRTSDSLLSYDKETNEISYREFVFNTKTGFFQATGKILTLGLVDDQFVSK